MLILEIAAGVVIGGIVLLLLLGAMQDYYNG